MGSSQYSEIYGKEMQVNVYLESWQILESLAET